MKGEGGEEDEETPLAKAECVQCGAVFEYELKRRGNRGQAGTRSKCDRCKAHNARKSRDHWTKNYRLGPDEATGKTMEGVYALALMTEAEAGAILGVTQQAVQKTTRTALLRLRRLLVAPVRVYREPVEPLEFGYHEIERELRAWRAAIEAIASEAGELQDGELAALVRELTAVVDEFAGCLKAAMDGQKKTRRHGDAVRERDRITE